MRHARNRSPVGRIPAVTWAIVIAVALAGCGNGPVDTPAEASAASSDASTATPASAMPEPSATTIESTAYPYSWAFPADVVTLAPRLARAQWDGVSPCIVEDPCTDWMRLTGLPKPIDRSTVGLRDGDGPDARRVRRRRPATDRRVASVPRRARDDAGCRPRRRAGEVARIRVHVRGKQGSPAAGVRGARRDRAGDRDGEAQRRAGSSRGGRDRAAAPAARGLPVDAMT